MIKKKRPIQQSATIRAECRASVENAMRELEALEKVLKENRKQMRALWLTRDALLAECRRPAANRSDAAAQPLQTDGPPA
ncbi:hypothetical protein ACFPFP_40130 [Bradyrhizobium sp. GCM10023182]|uniref:Uncharacterized protein n=1 Tax=Bradyrhizobium zhengyangense TaxID=2911009 RepID=A0ABS9M1F3_9BRAD|nr:MULTISPECIES: hypothetical protein [Bradyrhizobium]MCG2673095.1 hypothetical protein [Bradyrhizobium zhengyangense]